MSISVHAKDSHSCSISNFYILAQANTYFEAKIKEALYIYKIYTKIKQPDISLWFFIFVNISKKHALVLIKCVPIQYFLDYCS